MKDNIIRWAIIVALAMPILLVFSDNIYIQILGVAYIYLLCYLRMATKKGKKPHKL